jgi:hypothetical protein
MRGWGSHSSAICVIQCQLTRDFWLRLLSTLSMSVIDVSNVR